LDLIKFNDLKLVFLQLDRKSKLIKAYQWLGKKKYFKKIVDQIIVKINPLFIHGFMQ